jgi:hypothetical protein
MKNKDHLMLEEAYTQIYKEKWENDEAKYICVNTDNGEYHTFNSFDEAKQICDQANSDDNTDVWVVNYNGNVIYPKEKNETVSNNPLPPTDPYVNYENFVHGIQPISEAKKKSVNPYAVCTASVGRKDEEKYKSCKKKVASGAKKIGKKVTTKPVKKK